MANTVFRNRQRTSTRSGILKAEATYKFAKALQQLPIETFADVLKSGLRNDLRQAIKTIPGQSSGLSYAYFLILAGNQDGVKADRMVTRFVANALGVRIIRLLRTVKLLHESGAVHRDITPGNVFVTSSRVLKLGDFGIALHRVGLHDVSADVFAPWFAPSGMGNLGKATWRPADDVYHLGQLFAILLCSCAESKLTARDVKKLSCSPEAKSIIQRCIGVRRKRFPNAAVMLNALEKHDSKTIKRVIVRSLKGKKVVFTGTLSIRRSDAERLVRKVGGIVERRVGHETNVLVLGRQSPNWKADSKGQKLLDTDREREFGRNIARIGEKRFLTLAGVVQQ